MSMKKPMFVVTNYDTGSIAATTTRCGFFVAIFSSFDTDSGVIAFVKPDFSESVTLCPVLGWSRSVYGTAFSISAIHEGSIYINRIKRPKNTMRTTQSTTLDFIKERVSNVHNLLETKRTLNEVFLAYYLSQGFVESHDDYRNEVAYLAVLLNDLLDELFVSLQTSRPCKN